MSTEHKTTVVRDAILFVGGLLGIGYQQVTGNVDVVLLMIYTAMTGVPGLTNMVSLIRGSPTASPSSPPPSAESDSDSGN